MVLYSLRSWNPCQSEKTLKKQVATFRIVLCDNQIASSMNQIFFRSDRVDPRCSIFGCTNTLESALPPSAIDGNSRRIGYSVPSGNTKLVTNDFKVENVTRLCAPCDSRGVALPLEGVSRADTRLLAETMYETFAYEPLLSLN